MIDLGKKMGNEIAQPSTSKKNAKYYPSIHIDKKLGIKSEDHGKTFSAKVKLKHKGSNMNVGEDGKETHSHHFEVQAMSLGDSEDNQETRNVTPKERRLESARQHLKGAKK